METPAREAGYRPPKLVVMPSAYPGILRPLAGLYPAADRGHRDRSIAVIVPELVERKWYHFLVSHRATLFKGLLLLKGGPPQIVIVNAQWYLSE